jgi:hypothetical protein
MRMQPDETFELDAGSPPPEKPIKTSAAATAASAQLRPDSVPQRSVSPVSDRSSQLTVAGGGGGSSSHVWGSPSLVSDAGGRSTPGFGGDGGWRVSAIEE